MKITLHPLLLLGFTDYFCQLFSILEMNFSALNVKITPFCRPYLQEIGYLCTSNLLISRL